MNKRNHKLVANLESPSRTVKDRNRIHYYLASQKQKKSQSSDFLKYHFLASAIRTVLDVIKNKLEVNFDPELTLRLIDSSPKLESVVDLDREFSRAGMRSSAVFRLIHLEGPATGFARAISLGSG